MNRGGKKQDPTALGKDLDFKRTIHVGEETKQKIVSLLTKDSEFLCSLDILDYSLLVGIHSLKERKEQFGTVYTSEEYTITDKEELLFMNEHKSKMPFYQTFEGGLLSSDEQEIYYFGLIDILTPYDFDKKSERFVKVYLLREDKKGVSVQSPPAYSQRFIQFITKIFE